MPLLKLQVSATVPDEKKESLLAESSRIIAEVTGKPETYVMVMLEEGAAAMGGRNVSAAFADVRGIGGLTREVNAGISAGLCDLLKRDLDIEPDNVYLNFTDVPGTNWGWKGDLFG